VGDQGGSALPPRRSDGEETHAAILDAAMRLASIEGLGALTIGRLARELGMSKSGVFAHFRSKERLQLETIEAAREVFQREVLAPGLAGTPGLAQLETLCEAFLSYVERAVFPGGCFFAQLLGEYDAETGRLHDEVADDQNGWLGLLADLAGAAQERGELGASVDVDQLAFELFAALDLANYLTVLNRDPAMVDRGRAAVRAAIAGAAHDRALPGAR
jgi:AcrR family transcriptional regulator